MKWIGVILVAALTSPVHAEICGQYQVEDFGDRVVYSIFDFQTFAPLAMLYTITNPTSLAVNSMVNHLCYCVEGGSVIDPQYGGDKMFNTLYVTAVKRGPYSDCRAQP